MNLIWSSFLMNANLLIGATFWHQLYLLKKVRQRNLMYIVIYQQDLKTLETNRSYWLTKVFLI